jgi:hypothetical protein
MHGQAREHCTMNTRDSLRYDVLIYGQAALLAAEHST